MPFLNRIGRWASSIPDQIAVSIEGRGRTWFELQAAVERLVTETSAVSVLSASNSLQFVERYCAGLAGNRRVAVLDPEWPEGVLAGIQTDLAQPCSAPSASCIDGDDATEFLVGFTAGTTGPPKAFGRTRYSWRRSFEASIAFFNLARGDVTLAPGPLAASLNLYALSECLFAGSQFHTLESFDVGKAHSSITHDGITRLVVAPAHLRALSEIGLVGSVDASAISSIICAGSKLDNRTLEAARRWAPNARIYEYYGAAELSFVAGRVTGPHEPSDPENTRIGRAFPGVEVKVLDPAGSVVREGTPGAIWVKSPFVGTEYLDPGAGGKLQGQDGWCTVGDVGYLVGHDLHILGRDSDVIMCSGSRIYPHELELVLSSIPGVEAAMVLGVPDDLRGESIIVALVPSIGGISGTSLSSAIADRIADDKCPQRYYTLKELPASARGKPGRNTLRRWILDSDPRLRRL
ncbi:acyl-CoA synthetase (AMP-forming)/AMP-acid ligase II [Paenarthrobacter nicotinovorans]|uniref:class I adenylate-forming enzyme family protein n=1 Tax=Paenarthrobacter nicotinovorans TaxID=29320 RepID=UPI00277D3390|nr:AMP-binding protein [Paenarthrobacter nicotinovorans]MDP9933794.1 acyl-CoA synthetase (AMP-forming)/AMP-acid ligase II [Paenarthrobacter nicotinovorans]